MTGGPCIVKRISGCGVGTEYVAVTPSGDLYPCHQFVGDERTSCWATSTTVSPTHSVCDRVQVLQYLLPRGMCRLLRQALLQRRLRGQRPSHHRLHHRSVRPGLPAPQKTDRMRHHAESRRDVRRTLKTQNIFNITIYRAYYYGSKSTLLP